MAQLLNLGDKKIIRTDRPLKVALIEPVGGHGGMIPYDVGLTKGLNSVGVDVAWFTCDQTPDIEGVDIRKTYSRVFGEHVGWIRALRFIKGTIASIVSATVEGRSICHFQIFNTGFLEFAGVLVARCFFRKVVVTVHDVEPLIESRSIPLLMNLIYFMAKKIVVHNVASQKELKMISRIPTEKICVIRHGNYLDTIGDIPNKALARNKLGLKDNANIILFFGQIKNVKGLDILLEAMVNVVEEHPDAVCLIAGRPWKLEYREFELLIDRLGIKQNIVADIRYIPDDEIKYFYSASDLVVLPYRKIYQSGVLLLAMSYQRPVLVSNLPGMTEIVSDGVNGHVFETGSVESLAEKIIWLFDKSDNENEVGIQGCNHVRESYDWGDIGAATRDLYLSCLSHEFNNSEVN
jgi:glycosyltransferase involved in cell wall biosynthesis